MSDLFAVSAACRKWTSRRWVDLAALEKSQMQKDLQAVFAEAHGIKGSAMNTSCPALAAAAKAMELAARDGDECRLEGLLAALEQEVEQMRSLLRAQNE